MCCQILRSGPLAVCLGLLMTIDDEYAAILDAMDAAASEGAWCDWRRCQVLLEEALSLLDDCGRGHIPAALHLSSALLALREAAIAEWKAGNIMPKPGSSISDQH